MAVVFNFVLPVIAGLLFLAVVYFLVRAIKVRSKASSKPYNVGRQEARQNSRVNIIRAIFVLLLALIILGVMVIVPQIIDPARMETAATPILTEESTTAVPTAIPTFTIQPPTAEPTSTIPQPTSTRAPLPTVTSTPEPLTAVVISENGLWLRDAPGIESEQLEWLLFNTVLIVLDEKATVDELEWQQVQTQSGINGWVALEFISINTP